MTHHRTSLFVIDFKSTFIIDDDTSSTIGTISQYRQAKDIFIERRIHERYISDRNDFDDYVSDRAVSKQ
uniref:Uncharacterized protein n=1 Tax=Onchocerca volvulus TaxID=6282 RepID=A0A8R1U0G6_ONCVO